MEILSTGEKIKRARVYQGITLKELCCDKVSISKMSCIENGKIKAGNDILKYISNKLNIDYDYLIRDVKDQIITNIKSIDIKLISKEEVEKLLTHNLNYSLEYSYYDLAFEITHKLFDFYIRENKVENVQVIISQYYELYQKNDTIENTIIYFWDMATFFYSRKEYNEAITYYQRIKDIIINKDNMDKEKFSYASYYEGKAYEKLNQIEKAFNSIKDALKYVESVKLDLYKGKIFHAYATLGIRLDKRDYHKYMDDSYIYLEKYPMAMAIAKRQNSESFFYINKKEIAIEEIRAGIEIFPETNIKENVKFLNKCIRTLYDNEEYSYAYEITDNALDYAIKIDDIVQMEETYYLKGIILQKMKLYNQAETYMNFSLDALFKFSDKEKKYQRYLELGDMYHNIGDIKDSLKYFSLAMKMEED
ncbi:helix-turn-helix transcriptional regulator [Clostridium sp.]|uniref:helix-turn-helix domain-containing protein n=1 Tax=Clostridium sp. TaxID=1506 RepID=UPI002611F7D7|nr:helix-turn-helix transcriptional regulator [Clostridium sp.]